MLTPDDASSPCDRISRRPSIQDLAASPELPPITPSRKQAPRFTRRKSWRKLIFNGDSWVRVIVDSKLFTLFTTVLTIWALVEGDLRLILTDMTADPLLDSFTIVCIVGFTVEILMCCWCKADYVLSFFFFLDFISTLTLFFELSVIADSLFGADEDVAPETGDSGFVAQVTSLVTARAGRVVRILRLVRILKLYKLYREARQKRRRRLRSDGNDDPYSEQHGTAIDADMDLGDVFKNQTRVGKKLSDKTTRQVIVLVLVMMIVLPWLRVDPVTQFPTSPQYAAEYVHSAFTKYINETGQTSVGDRSYWKSYYETQLLQLIYYYNWWTKREGKCPFDTTSARCPVVYDSQVFWVGVASKSRTRAEELAVEAQISEASVDAYQNRVSEEWHYNYGAMPDEVAEIMSSPWDQDCPHDSGLQRLGFSIISLNIDGANPYTVTCPSGLRRIERRKFYAKMQSRSSWDDWHFAIYFDLRPWVRGDAFANLRIMCFICLSLVCASISFSNDADTLVLQPVENMIGRVEKIRQSPLMAMKMADQHEPNDDPFSLPGVSPPSDIWTRIRNKLLCSSPQVKGADLMETIVLEKTIIQLGFLLALGFGEAGAQVIQQNLKGLESAAVNAMVSGTRVDCIIGITRISNFRIATEVLNAKVMTFVNQVAEIVHGVTGAFSGAANKNNGDVFLVVWRSSQQTKHKMEKLADMSMMAVTTILGAVHRSPTLAQYRAHPCLQQRLGKDCRIHLTSSLHYGWAIEGAVGTEFKIDASYLSPNVSIAETIERATRYYSVSILVSESVVDICSAGMASKCRKIDRVVIRGQPQAMALFSIDLDHTSIDVEDEYCSHGRVWTSAMRYKAQQRLEVEKKEKWADDCHIATLFNDSPDISKMRFRYTVEFFQVFNMGYQNYSLGEWQVARKLLHRTRTMLGLVDGPSNALLLFMGTNDFEPPSDWKGFRPLNLD